MTLKSLLLGTALTVGLTAAAFAQSNPTPQPQDPAAQTTPSQDQSTPTQTPNTQSPSTSQQPGDTTSATSGSAGQQVFTGSIVKSGGKYVLHSAGADYQLDDQSQAKSFNGKDVKVNGELDKSGSTIKVKSIEPASSM